MIPLWFLNQHNSNYKVVRIGLSGLPFSSHYILGQCIQKTAELLGRRIAVIASGDLETVKSFIRCAVDCLSQSRDSASCQSFFSKISDDRP
ncbi:MAG: hypothetical protein ACOX8E_12905 [Ruminococcus sp.]|jgi:aromatic ring-opening dioxygenase catalytic subunit (LigB family)